MLTTAEQITSVEDLGTFLRCYDRAYGASILTLEFLQGCDEVYMFRDHDGNPVAGYTINTEQAYRTLEFIPAEFATFYREKASGVLSYELGTIWVEQEKRNGRGKLELWLHIFGNMISRADTMMVGSTGSEEIYRFYARYGMKLAYYGPMRPMNQDYIEGWIIYCDDITQSKVPEMYEALKKRLA
jgi:hypothetical protein